MFDPDGTFTEGAPKTLNALWAVRDSRMSAKQKAVMMALILRANWKREGWKCHPSLNTIAKDTGLSRRCIMGVLNELVTLVDVRGWHIVERESGNSETSNEYTLNFEAIVTLLPHTPPKKRR